MLRRITLLFAMALAAIGLPLTNAHAKQAPVYTSAFSNVAVGGFDPVAYFTEGKPVKGDSSFSLQHAGAQWHFASAANRDKFAAAPQRYAPQYGGYCAWAAAQGYTASGNPQNWKIVDDKLYLNYDSAVQKKWEQDIPGFIAEADKNWPAVLEK
jgi:YHS domain-containing protein